MRKYKQKTAGCIGLFVLIGCKGKPVHDATSSDTIRVENSPLKERLAGWQVVRRLQKAYGLSGDFVSDPACPAFLMGIYLDKGVPVIQVEGDTVLIRQELEEKLESDAFRLELTGKSMRILSVTVQEYIIYR